MTICRKCNGSGSYTNIIGKLDKCMNCDNGFFPEVDAIKIYEVLKGRKGLRTTKPFKHSRTVFEHRSNYVWRMARFHGGVDVTIPVMVTLYVHYDPELDRLNQLADEVALRFFGSNMEAAKRWGSALGHIN